jgi:UDP-galactopyranose mutase
MMPPRLKEKTDILIAGAGFSGMVLAERFASHGLKCTILEKRPHIGGNAWDCADRNGLLYHPYGPHYFRTNSRAVREYLSRFTEWQHVDYRIKSWTHGRYWSFPVNLETFEQLIAKPATEDEFKAWLAAKRVPIPEPKNSEEVILSQVGHEFYEMFFRGYTIKHWHRHPRELDPSVTARIPIRTIRDDHYLREEFQALPRLGYNHLFENILASTPNIEVKLGVDFQEARHHYEARHTIYTGPVDCYFDYCHGRLPWRSLRFEMESFTADRLAEREPIAGKKGFWQPAMQVNYPNDHEFTRIVEIKHATGQQSDCTNIVREYSQDDAPGREPYYPIPAPDARAMYEKYRTLAAAEPGVSFVGRLATYHYYNMDQVTAMALHEFDRLTGPSGPFAGLLEHKATK